MCKQHHGLSLIEFVLVLVAVGFLLLGGIRFIAVQAEQTKIRKAADQIEGWLLAAQSYYRNQVDAGNSNKWPVTLSDLYPFIADSTTQDKLTDTNTKNPWGDSYIVQPSTYYYQPVYLPTSANDIVDPSTFQFFTLQMKVSSIKRALAITSRLATAELARDRTNGDLLQDSDGNYMLNAMIPPPPIVKSELHHQLIANLGVVKTKTNLANSHNGYNYSLPYPGNYLANFAPSTNGSGLFFIRPEFGGRTLSQDKIDKYGAIFIRKPFCPKGMRAHLQASIAGFGILGGYSTQYNNHRSDGTTVPANTSTSPYYLFSTAPVPQQYGNHETVTKNATPDNNTAFPLYQMDMTAANNNSSEFYMGDNMPLSNNRLLGAVIGAHIRQSAEQAYIKRDGSESQTITGWYLWLDITANMAMYPNYEKDKLPKVIQDCALNVNTLWSQFPYSGSGFDTGLSNIAYNYIPQSPNVVTDPGDPNYGRCPSGSCPMSPADLILRGASPMYLPSPCHFHNGYIAYITSCIPTEAVSGDFLNGEPQSLEQEYGLDQAQAQLQK